MIFEWNKTSFVSYDDVANHKRNPPVDFYTSVMTFPLRFYELLAAIESNAEKKLSFPSLLAV